MTGSQVNLGLCLGRRAEVGLFAVVMVSAQHLLHAFVSLQCAGTLPRCYSGPASLSARSAAAVLAHLSAAGDVTELLGEEPESPFAASSRLHGAFSVSLPLAATDRTLDGPVFLSCDERV